MGTAYDRVLNELFAPPPENGSEMAGFSAALGYLPMLLPQSIGLLIGRLLGANFWIAFYLGRLTNLLFFILCVYFAIRIAPRFKLLFCMVGLMPMALQQAASFSYDTFINGMSILMFAFLLRALDKKGTIRSRDILPIAIIGALLAPSKIIYVSLLFIMFALPAKRFVDKKHYWLSLATVMCSAMIVLLLFQLKSILSASTTAGAPSKNWEGAFNYSFADFIERPMVILRVYYLSFRTMIWMWFEQAIGHVLSGQTMIIDQWCVSVYLILLVLSAFGTRNERTTTGRERFVFAVSALLPVLLLMVIMLVSWTTNTYDTIQGVQGRYFIPCVPLALMCLNSRLVRIKKPISKYLIMTGILVNLSALQQVLFKTLLS